MMYRAAVNWSLTTNKLLKVSPRLEESSLGGFSLPTIFGKALAER